jgi:hypothetical protein
MNYEEGYKKDIETYEAMRVAYEKETESAKYHEAMRSMPYEFLNARHLVDTLSLYKELAEKPKLHFSSVDEAIVFYRSLITFKTKTQKLLDEAAYLSDVGKQAEKINSFIEDSAYLGSALCVAPDTKVIGLAQECLMQVPGFPKLLTKSFRYSFLEACIESFPKEDLLLLSQMHVIKTDDIDHIDLTNKDPKYQENIAYLCGVLGHKELVLATFEQRLKGVTFPNDDGTSRQENLAELAKFRESYPEGKITLQAERYEYRPDIGNPEPAIRILWDGKGIGNIDKNIVAQLMERFHDPQFTATLKSISGGTDGMSYGCTISLHVTAPYLAKEEKEVASSPSSEKEKKEEKVIEKSEAASLEL